MNDNLHLPDRLQSWAGMPSFAEPDRFSKATLVRMGTQQYIKALKRRWWVPLVSLLVFGGPAVYYTLQTPATYRSQTLLWAGNKLEVPEPRLYSEELSGYLGTQVELIKSAAIKDRAIARVQERYPEAVPDEKALALTAANSFKSSTIQVSAVGRSPDATRFFVDALIEEYRNFKQESRKATSGNALSTITEQIKSVEKEVQLKQQAITRFQTSNNIAFLTESGVSAGSHLARLTELLSDLRTEYHVLEVLTPDQLRDIAEAPPGTSTGVIVPGQRAAQSLVNAAGSSAQQSGYFQALQQLELLEAKRNSFAKVLRPTHSKMVKFNQEIAGLQQLLDTLKTKSHEEAMAQMANRRKSLELQIENLENQYKSWQSNSLEASARLIEHDRMKQELDRSTALYNRLLNLVQNVDITKNLDQDALTQVAPASIAKPTLTRYKPAAAGIFLGLVIGFGALFFLTVADDRFNSATELTLHLPEEIVGQIPESSVRRINQGNGERSPKQLEQQHAFDESFRSLRSYLLCMSDLPPGPRVIMVSSTVPEEGKTTVSANLGAALALAGKKVLLIDADLRRSSLHRIFDVPQTPGLREVLGQKISAREAIRSLPHPDLFLMPAGDGETSGSELFLMRTMERLLAELGAQYEYIIIDSAPVLATDDAASLGPKTQGIFMVVRDSYTSAGMVREALDRLHKRKVKILGVVYNRVSQSRDYYSQYSRDYYAPKEIASLPGTARKKRRRSRAGNGEAKADGS